MRGEAPFLRRTNVIYHDCELKYLPPISITGFFFVNTNLRLRTSKILAKRYSGYFGSHLGVIGPGPQLRSLRSDRVNELAWGAQTKSKLFASATFSIARRQFYGRTLRAFTSGKSCFAFTQTTLSWFRALACQKWWDTTPQNKTPRKKSFVLRSRRLAGHHPCRDYKTLSTDQIYVRSFEQKLPFRRFKFLPSNL